MSGMRYWSLSAIRVKPSIDEPSNQVPCLTEPSSWWIGIVTALTWPMMSVNWSWTKRIPASTAASIVLLGLASLSVSATGRLLLLVRPGPVAHGCRPTVGSAGRRSSIRMVGARAPLMLELAVEEELVRVRPQGDLLRLAARACTQIQVSITSGVKTSPRSRKSWSALERVERFARASPGSGLMPCFASSGELVDVLVDRVAGGSILLLMPSRPAISMAEKARYGLHVGSGAAELDPLAPSGCRSTSGCGRRPSGCAGSRPG